MCDLGQVSLSCTQSTKIYRAPNTYCSKRRSQTQICLTCSSAFFPHTELCPEKASTELFKAWRWAARLKSHPPPLVPRVPFTPVPWCPPHPCLYTFEPATIAFCQHPTQPSKCQCRVTIALKPSPQPLAEQLCSHRTCWHGNAPLPTLTRDIDGHSSPRLHRAPLPGPPGHGLSLIHHCNGSR